MQGLSVRILVADDFPQWRVRVRSILQARPEWEVIGEACNGLQAVQRTTQLHPDVVLLDVGMPIMDGIKAAAQIREWTPGSKIIFVTQDGDEDMRTAALALGAEAYVMKENAASELLPTIETALRDRVPV